MISIGSMACHFVRRFDRMKYARRFARKIARKQTTELSTTRKL